MKNPFNIKRFFAEGLVEGARNIPKALLEGILDIIEEPPRRALRMYESLGPEDRELIRKAGLAAMRLGAKAIIAADRHYKF